MDHLTTIFLRIFPTIDINALDKVFEESIILTKQANPNGGGLMVLTQASTIIITYHDRVQVIPSQFIPLNPILLQKTLVVTGQSITYSGYEPTKYSLFEQKVATSTKTKNNITIELGQMKKTMSQITNEITYLRLSQGHNTTLRE